VVQITSNSPLQVQNHTVDVTPPQVIGFTLSFTQRVVILTFSEPVVVDTAVASFITLQSSATSATYAHRLTSSYVLGVGSNATNATVAVKLTKFDLDSIKELYYVGQLATSELTTFLSIDANIAQDYAENRALEIRASNALRVATYEKDSGSPNLILFNLDIDSGALMLSFDEVVRASSVNPSGLRLANSGNAPLQVSPSLNGTVSVIDGLVIDVMLTVDSANDVRALTSLAIDKDSTYVLVDSSAFADVDGNPAAVIGAANGLQVNDYTADMTPPVATGFAINMDTGEVAVFYDQPVNGSSLDITAFTLQDSSTDPTTIFSFTGGNPTADVSTSVIITMTVDDLNELKRVPVCDAELGVDGCFMRFGPGSVVDATGLSVASIAEGTLVAGFDSGPEPEPEPEPEPGLESSLEPEPEPNRQTGFLHPRCVLSATPRTPHHRRWSSTAS
jgi:hypothetical protein